MDFPHLVLARVYEHIEPIDRGDRVFSGAGGERVVGAVAGAERQGAGQDDPGKQEAERGHFFSLGPAVPYA